MAEYIDAPDRTHEPSDGLMLHRKIYNPLILPPDYGKRGNRIREAGMDEVLFLQRIRQRRPSRGLKLSRGCVMTRTLPGVHADAITLDRDWQ